MINHKLKIKISARFWPIFDFNLNEKKVTSPEKPSARAMGLGSDPSLQSSTVLLFICYYIFGWLKLDGSSP